MKNKIKGLTVGKESTLKPFDIANRNDSPAMSGLPSQIPDTQRQIFIEQLNIHPSRVDEYWADLQAHHKPGSSKPKPDFANYQEPKVIPFSTPEEP